MLPFLGGAASVWITCLLFFQLMLLTGYGYAHVLERFTGVRGQIVVHSAMLLAAFVFLPVEFASRPDAAASAHASAWLLWQLVKTVGVPFAVVSTTAPLLQNWLAKTRFGSERDPYFLYAISNAGSLDRSAGLPVVGRAAYWRQDSELVVAFRLRRFDSPGIWRIRVGMEEPPRRDLNRPRNAH